MQFVEIDKGFAILGGMPSADAGEHVHSPVLVSVVKMVVEVAKVSRISFVAVVTAGGLG